MRHDLKLMLTRNVHFLVLALLGLALVAAGGNQPFHHEVRGGMDLASRPYPTTPVLFHFGVGLLMLFAIRLALGLGNSVGRAGLAAFLALLFFLGLLGIPTHGPLGPAVEIWMLSTFGYLSFLLATRIFHARTGPAA